MMRLARGALVALLMLCPSVAVYALTQAGAPPKFGVPWGTNAGAAYVRSIPQASQIGSQNCAASLTDGFPPLTFVPAAAGGCPPYGQDFNGILKQLSQWAQWQSAGGPVFFDAAFVTASGGYPNGAIINSAVTPGTRFMSTADNNATNPDASVSNQVVGGTNWVQLPADVPIGTPLQSFLTSPPNGYVIANGLTIGDGSSNATQRANADAQFLFAFVWNTCANTSCPIFTSGGGGTTRGATAAADWAAHKAIATPNMNGGGIVGADSQNGTTSTFLSGVPVTAGSRTVPASILGENFHALSIAELAAHQHSVWLRDPGHTHTYNSPTGSSVYGVSTSFALNSTQVLNTSNNVTNMTIGSVNGVANDNLTASIGSGTAHNTVARVNVVYWNMKL